MKHVRINSKRRPDETEMEMCQRKSYRAGREAEIRTKHVCVVNQTPLWFLARLQVMTGALERQGSKKSGKKSK